MLRDKGRVTTTACANYSGSVLPRNIDFKEEGKSDYPEKNPQSTAGINYVNSSPKLPRAFPEMYSHQKGNHTNIVAKLRNFNVINAPRSQILSGCSF